MHILLYVGKLQKDLFIWRIRGLKRISEEIKAWAKLVGEITFYFLFVMVGRK